MRYFEIINEDQIKLGNPQSIMKVGDVTFDQKDGIGQVPNNQNVKYLGFACFMNYSQFARLATPRDFGEESNLKGLIAALKEGKSFGSPFLICDFSKNPILVDGHEGRTRAKAIELLYGKNAKILIHIFLRGGDRARHITLDQIKSFRDKAISEDSITPINGPNFDDKIWFLDGWKTI